jgi:hypothetical protein
MPRNYAGEQNATWANLTPWWLSKAKLQGSEDLVCGWWARYDEERMQHFAYFLRGENFYSYSPL